MRSWDQPLALTSGLSWQGARASVSAIVGWHRGWPRTPFELPGSDGALELGLRGSERWGDFYSLDLRGAWTWPIANGELAAVLEITNATNRHNECCVDFEREEFAEPLEAEFSHWLPFIVNLGVTFRFHSD